VAVIVRFWAAARSAAGTTESEYDDADSLADLLAALADRHGPGLAKVLGVASYLVDSQPVGRRDPAGVAVPPGSVVEVLPPFAGG
jgi:molybdopterin converting factor small subunit